MPKNDNPKPETTPSPDALEQAAQYGGPFAPKYLHFDDGEPMKICPHPAYRLFDSEEALTAYDQHMVDIEENFDREPDIYIAEQKIKTEDGGEVVLPAETKRGAVKPPYRKDGVLVSPSHEVLLVQIALGEAKYAQLKTQMIGGRPASYADVWRLWLEAGDEGRARAAADSKSVGSATGVEGVASADSE